MWLSLFQQKIKEVIHPVYKDFFPTKLSTGWKSSYPMLLSGYHSVNRKSWRKQEIIKDDPWLFHSFENFLWKWCFFCVAKDLDVYFLPLALRGQSVQFSCSVVSNSLRPHEPQPARPPCPWPTPRVHPNPCPLSRWCHPIILSSVIPFSSCPQSFPATGPF